MPCSRAHKRESYYKLSLSFQPLTPLVLASILKARHSSILILYLDAKWGERFGEPGLIFQKVTWETGVVIRAYNPSPWKLRQEDLCELEASLDCVVSSNLECMVRLCLKKKWGREGRRGKHNSINRQREHAEFKLRDLPAPGWCARGLCHSISISTSSDCYVWHARKLL